MMGRDTPLKKLLILSCVGFLGLLLKLSSSFLSPFLMSLFLAGAFLPLFLKLRKREVPRGLATFLVLLLFLIITATFGLVFWWGASQLQANYPQYKTLFFEHVREAGTHVGLKLDPKSLALFASGHLVSHLFNVVLGLSDLVTRFIIVMVVGMMLLNEAHTIQLKFETHSRDYPELRRKLVLALHSIEQYLRVKVLTSAVTALCAGVAFFFLHLPNKVFLIALTFVLNFIPIVGSLAATIPALFFAFVTPQNFLLLTLYTTLALLLINLCVGMFLEPRISGNALDLTPLAVILALSVWTYFFGLTGALIGVPLTRIFLIFLETSPHTNLQYFALFFKRVHPDLINSKERERRRRKKRKLQKRTEHGDPTVTSAGTSLEEL